MQASRERHIERNSRIVACACDGLNEGASSVEWTVSNLDNGVTLVAVTGRMDVPGALKADPAFAEIARGSNRLIVDLSRLDFLASLGIRTLVTTCKTLRAKDGSMVLLSPQPSIEKTLRSSGIDTIIPLVKDRAAAEASVLA